MSRSADDAGPAQPSSVDNTPDLAWMRSSLTSALVADSMDALGLASSCLGQDIGPLCGPHGLVGRAFTVRQIEVDERPLEPYRGLLKALEAIGPDEIFVIPTSRSSKAAVWGELLSTASVHQGAVGALTDGLVRDSAKVRALGFPVFARGTHPLDTNGRLEITGIASECTIDGVQIRRGDLIVGDEDGVVIVPWSTVPDVIAQARAKLLGEADFRRAVSGGVPPSVAFERFRVL